MELAASSYATEDKDDRAVLKQPFHVLADLGHAASRLLQHEHDSYESKPAPRDPFSSARSGWDPGLARFITRLENDAKELEEVLGGHGVVPRPVPRMKV